MFLIWSLYFLCFNLYFYFWKRCLPQLPTASVSSLTPDTRYPITHFEWHIFIFWKRLQVPITYSWPFLFLLDSSALTPEALSDLPLQLGRSVSSPSPTTVVPASSSTVVDNNLLLSLLSQKLGVPPPTPRPSPPPSPASPMEASFEYNNYTLLVPCLSCHRSTPLAPMAHISGSVVFRNYTLAPMAHISGSVVFLHY